MSSQSLQIVIDGNEANTPKRVGSNVYAFEILKSIEELTRSNNSLNFTILLRKTAFDDLPPERNGWKYKVIKPSFLWTQFAEPLHLFLNKDNYDILFTPGHYAPRNCPIPYISSIMDLAFLKYPDQFEKSNLVQLKHWTKYSAKHAKKIIAISQFTKTDIIKEYRKKNEDIVVAPPAIPNIMPAATQQSIAFFKKHHLKKPYFLFIGTIQPRKNLEKLVEAYEKFCRQLSSQQLNRKSSPSQLPQLVLAGKIGWLSEPIIDRIIKSPFFDHIILPGFIPEKIKPSLYRQATASLLLGLYEGFGIPPLESLYYGCIPIVSNTTSLPEVVGDAGIKVDPTNTEKIAESLRKTYNMTIKTKAVYRRKGKQQLQKFNWKKSATIILDTIEKVAHDSQ
jgi:glycosyltransferase involved in cell wall biosynthesis